MSFLRTVKKHWLIRQKKRSLEHYYWSHYEKPPGESLFFYLVIFTLGSVFIFWQASTFLRAYLGVGCLLFLMLASRSSIKKKKLIMAKKICHEQMGAQELLKALEHTPPGQILENLKEAIMANYPVTDLQIIDSSVGMMEGKYQGAKIRIHYHHLLAGENLETREVMGIIKKARQQGIKELRIFTNGEYSSKYKLEEHYPDIKLKIHNLTQLKSLLANTSLYPTTEQLENLALKASEKQQQRLSILKKQALQSDKTFTYLIYSTVLLVSAYYKIGFYYLNLVAGFMLLGFALTIFALKRKAREEEVPF